MTWGAEVRAGRDRVRDAIELGIAFLCLAVLIVCGIPDEWDGTL